MISLYFFFSISLFLPRQTFLVSSSSSTSPFLHPIVSSYTPPHLSFLCISSSSYKHINWTEPSSLKETGVFKGAAFFLKREKERADIKWEALSFLCHSQDNQVLLESSGRLKGACVEAESAGASAPRGHLGPFDSIQASLHLLTCP